MVLCIATGLLIWYSATAEDFNGTEKSCSNTKHGDLIPPTIPGNFLKSEEWDADFFIKTFYYMQAINPTENDKKNLTSYIYAAAYAQGRWHKEHPKDGTLVIYKTAMDMLENLFKEKKIKKQIKVDCDRLLQDGFQDGIRGTNNHFLKCVYNRL